MPKQSQKPNSRQKTGQKNKHNSPSEFISRETKKNIIWLVATSAAIIVSIISFLQNEFWFVFGIFITFNISLLRIYYIWPTKRTKIIISILAISAYFVSQFWQSNLSQKLAQTIQNHNSPLENKFYDFRVISESDCELQLEVWHYYDGSFGTEMIYIDINLLDADKIPLDSACGSTGSQILAEKIKVIAKIDLDCSVIGESEYIELCMEHSIRGGAHFYCETFPLEKTWDCK